MEGVLLPLVQERRTSSRLLKWSFLRSPKSQHTPKPITDRSRSQENIHPLSVPSTTVLHAYLSSSPPRTFSVSTLSSAMLAKGHVQPHHNNVPRRRQRTQSPLGTSSAPSKVKPSGSSAPRSDAQTGQSRAPPRFARHFTDSTRSTSSSAVDSPSPGTPLTSPSDEILSSDALPDTNKPLTSPLQLQSSVQGTNDDPSSSLGLLALPNPPNATLKVVPTSSAAQPYLATDGARGHLEPRVTNVPRRLSRAHKEREVRRKCLQEFITGSGVWIALNPRFSGADGDEEEILEDLTPEEMRERDWMWEEKFGFTGIIRVQVGRRHGYCRKVPREGSDGAEEMELVIGKERAMTCDDSGISALTDSQLEDAATFLAHHRRRKDDGSGKVLISVPPLRPVEALSIALFALSLPSTSSPSPQHSPSYLSQVQFLPGILDLEQSQEVDIDVVDDDTGHPEPDDTKYTLIQLALWHLHDIPAADVNSERGGLKQEWRGGLSLDGIERLENLVMSG